MTPIFQQLEPIGSEPELRTGEILRMSSMTVLKGKPVWENYQETWKCKKRGFRYVLVLIGTESDKEPLDEGEALKALGWRRQKRKERRIR